MKTLIIQSYRDHDVPAWIERCLASVKAWAYSRGYHHMMTDDRAFALCGDEYLAKVGDNKRSITNLCRLELIKIAHANGYDRAIWMDADIFVFDPERLDFPVSNRMMFPRETWLWPEDGTWRYNLTLNNCVVVCQAGDPDLDFVIQAIRHTARHRPVRSNFQLGVELIRGLQAFLDFELLPNVGLFSNFAVMAIARQDQEVMSYQAIYHQTPVYAANLCASDHLTPPVPEADAMRAMDVLEISKGAVLNDRLQSAAA